MFLSLHESAWWGVFECLTWVCACILECLNVGLCLHEESVLAVNCFGMKMVSLKSFAWVGDERVLACFCMGLSFAWELHSECLSMHEKFAWKMNGCVHGEWVCMVVAVCLRIWWFIVFAWWVVRRWEVSSSSLHEKEFLNFFCLSLFCLCLIVVY